MVEEAADVAVPALLVQEAVDPVADQQPPEHDQSLSASVMEDGQLMPPPPPPGYYVEVTGQNNILIKL